MKLMKIITSLSVCTIALSLFIAPTVATAETTTAKVKLLPNDGDEDTKAKRLIKPGTENEVYTLDEDYGSQSNKANIRFSFVPNLTFGKTEGNQVSALGLELPAQLVLVNGKKTGATYEKLALPPFVQVIDQRGDDVGFGVSLSMSDFEKNSGGSTHTLTGAKIRIYGQSLYNNTDEKPAIKTKKIIGVLEDPTLAGQKYFNEVSSEKDLQIMTTNNSATDTYIGSSISSLVFDGNYEPKNYGINRDQNDTFPELGATTDQIRLYIPVSAGMQPGTYKATLTWSLSLVPL